MVVRLSPERGETLAPAALERLNKAKADEESAKKDFAAMEGELNGSYSMSRWLALLLAAMLIVDAVLLPGPAQGRSPRSSAKDNGDTRANTT